jgi:hypothetical protein
MLCRVIVTSVKDAEVCCIPTAHNASEGGLPSGDLKRVGRCG